MNMSVLPDSENPLFAAGSDLEQHIIVHIRAASGHSYLLFAAWLILPSPRLPSKHNCWYSVSCLYLFKEVNHLKQLDLMFAKSVVKSMSQSGHPVAWLNQILQINPHVTTAAIFHCFGYNTATLKHQIRVRPGYELCFGLYRDCLTRIVSQRESYRSKTCTWCTWYLNCPQM